MLYKIIACSADIYSKIADPIRPINATNNTLKPADTNEVAAPLKGVIVGVAVAVVVGKTAVAVVAFEMPKTCSQRTPTRSRATVGDC